MHKSDQVEGGGEREKKVKSSFRKLASPGNARDDGEEGRKGADN